MSQVAQRGGEYPIPVNIQGQVRQGSEQPDLVENVPAHLTRWPSKVISNPKYFMILWLQKTLQERKTSNFLKEYELKTANVFCRKIPISFSIVLLINLTIFKSGCYPSSKDGKE